MSKKFKRVFMAVLMGLTIVTGGAFISPQYAEAAYYTTYEGVTLDSSSFVVTKDGGTYIWFDIYSYSDMGTRVMHCTYVKQNGQIRVMNDTHDGFSNYGTIYDGTQTANAFYNVLADNGYV